MPSNTCETAEILPDISADTNMEFHEVKGTGSRWFVITLTEDGGGGLPVSGTVSLTSAMGTDYDFNVKISNGGDNVDCNAVSVPGMQGNPETFQFWYPDNLGSNDDRQLAIQVVHITATECMMDDEWTLRIEGNNVPNP